MSFSVFQIRVNETGYANPRANHVPLIINAQNISSRGLESLGSTEMQLCCWENCYTFLSSGFDEKSFVEVLTKFI